VADANLNAALRPYAHPQASPGFGKRTVSDQRPRRKGDFAELPVWEAYLAAFIDGLSDGSAIDEASCRTPLRPHLRNPTRRSPWCRHLIGRSRPRRNGSSRLPRLRPHVLPARRPTTCWPPSDGPTAVSSDSRLVLSANECTALESDAAAWLERGADRPGS
jgi:hypothetical protein